MNEEEIEEEVEEEPPLIYVEIATNFLYEVKFFTGFVYVRPATPQFYTALRRMSHLEFAKEFDEYGGNMDEVRAFLHGLPPEIEIA